MSRVTIQSVEEDLAKLARDFQLFVSESKGVDGKAEDRVARVEGELGKLKKEVARVVGEVEVVKAKGAVVAPEVKGWASMLSFVAAAAAQDKSALRLFVAGFWVVSLVLGLAMVDAVRTQPALARAVGYALGGGLKAQQEMTPSPPPGN